jgi:Predicted periplasmic protein
LPFRRTQSGKSSQPNRNLAAQELSIGMWLWKTPPPVSAWLSMLQFSPPNRLRCVSSIILTAKAGRGDEARKMRVRRERRLFRHEFKPIGLRVADGTTFSPLRRARLITGILLQSDRALTSCVSVNFLARKKIVAAIQSGPFLVEGNKRIRGLNDSQLARRTFAGIATNDRAFLGVCSTFRLPSWQTSSPRRHRCGFENPRAMNLDGGSSSAFWFAREDGSAFSISGRKPVRDFVAVVPK